MDNADLRIALFSGNPKTPEISTVRANVAFVKLDRPVTNFAEMGARKIMALELSGMSLRIREKYTVLPGSNDRIKRNDSSFFISTTSSKPIAAGSARTKAMLSARVSQNPS